MVTIEGRIQRLGIGTPIWILTTREGKSYELLKGSPQALLQAGMQVRVKGEVRNDLPTLTAIGSGIEVKSFELVLP